MATALYGFEAAVVFKKELTGIRGKVTLKITGDDRFWLLRIGHPRTITSWRLPGSAGPQC